MKPFPDIFFLTELSKFSRRRSKAKEVKDKILLESIVVDLHLPFTVKRTIKQIISG